MSRTFREATVKHYHYRLLGQFRQYMQAFSVSDKRLKILKGLASYEYIRKLIQMSLALTYSCTCGLNTLSQALAFV